MSSFTKRLVLNCTGIIFTSFLIVYFLFNGLVENYIRAEAERELSGGIMDVITMTRGLPPVGRITGEIIAGENGEDGLRVQLEQIYATRPISRSIITTDIIMINERNEIIMPWFLLLDDTRRESIEFLANYYLSNQSRFADEEIVMANSANNTYYLRAVNLIINENPISILMYTDISSPVAFKDNMNQRLGLLLVISGVLTLGITILMSTHFKQAIKRLCRYAETIGHGNFNEKAGAFKYAEFNDLSKSMDNMSNMLQAYENNQKQFYQNVSHELRTPLMSIQGYAEGILEDIVDKDEAAGIILSAGHKMTDLVSGLLYISRIEEGLETPKNISSVDVKNLLSDCYGRVKPIAAKSNKEISIDALQEDFAIDTDEEKLERAIINILSNAIRHAERVIQISYCVTEGSLEIRVKDDGDGIALKDLPHIFERFYKGDDGNSGLGLAISKDIIKGLCGDIRAENLPSPQTGAVFTITLPTAIQTT